eukprot:s735_g3.t1
MVKFWAELCSCFAALGFSLVQRTVGMCQLAYSGQMSWMGQLCASVLATVPLFALGGKLASQANWMTPLKLQTVQSYTGLAPLGRPSYINIWFACCFRLQLPVSLGMLDVVSDVTG